MPTAQAKISALRSRLDATFFRDSPPATPAVQRRPELMVIAGLFLLAILLHLLWAEDGAVYLSGAVHNGFGGSLFDTYATYLVLVPRAIAELADLLPLADAPAGI